MVTMLLGAEAALDGGSDAVHDLPRAADPLAHREDHAPEGPHVSPAPASSLPGLVGARRRQPRERWGLMASGWRRRGGEGGDEPRKAMAAAEDGESGDCRREGEVNSSRPNLHGPSC
jgi:hypothetical protein